MKRVHVVLIFCLWVWRGHVLDELRDISSVEDLSPHSLFGILKGICNTTGSLI